jgi:hypothetical protein
MKKTESVAIKILKWFGIFLVVFFTLGVCSIFYTTYKINREPIYQTTATDFKLLIPKAKYAEIHPEFHTELQENLQKFIDSLKINTLQCFIFQAHSQRPIYCIYFIGKISPNKDFSNYSKKQHLLKEDISKFSVLKLCGAEPDENDEYIELTEPLDFSYYSVFIYKDFIIFSFVTSNQTFLTKDTQKQAFLSKFIFLTEM